MVPDWASAKAIGLPTDTTSILTESFLASAPATPASIPNANPQPLILKRHTQQPAAQTPAHTPRQARRRPSRQARHSALTWGQALVKRLLSRQLSQQTPLQIGLQQAGRGIQSQDLRPNGLRPQALPNHLTHRLRLARQFAQRHLPLALAACFGLALSGLFLLTLITTSLEAWMNDIGKTTRTMGDDIQALEVTLHRIQSFDNVGRVASTLPQVAEPTQVIQLRSDVMQGIQPYHPPHKTPAPRLPIHRLS